MVYFFHEDRKQAYEVTILRTPTLSGFNFKTSKRTYLLLSKLAHFFSKLHFRIMKKAYYLISCDQQ